MQHMRIQSHSQSCVLLAGEKTEHEQHVQGRGSSRRQPLHGAASPSCAFALSMPLRMGLPLAGEEPGDSCCWRDNSTAESQGVRGSSSAAQAFGEQGPGLLPRLLCALLVCTEWHGQAAGAPSLLAFERQRRSQCHHSLACPPTADVGCKDNAGVPCIVQNAVTRLVFRGRDVVGPARPAVAAAWGSERQADQPSLQRLGRGLGAAHALLWACKPCPCARQSYLYPWHSFTLLPSFGRRAMCMGSRAAPPSKLTWRRRGCRARQRCSLRWRGTGRSMPRLRHACMQHCISSEWAKYTPWHRVAPLHAASLRSKVFTLSSYCLAWPGACMQLRHAAPLATHSLVATLRTCPTR